VTHPRFGAIQTILGMKDIGLKISAPADLSGLIRCCGSEDTLSMKGVGNEPQDMIRWNGTIRALGRLLFSLQLERSCLSSRKEPRWPAYLIVSDIRPLRETAIEKSVHIQRNIVVYRCPLTSNTTLPSCLLRSSLSTSCVSSTSPHIPVCQFTSILAACAASSIPNFCSLF
jgi:hypothetical protein